jgi:hypothetical protein
MQKASLQAKYYLSKSNMNKEEENVNEEMWLSFLVHYNG